jgi:hypothetical protein
VPLILSNGFESFAGTPQAALQLQTLQSPVSNLQHQSFSSNIRPSTDDYYLPTYESLAVTVDNFSIPAQYDKKSNIAKKYNRFIKKTSTRSNMNNSIYSVFPGAYLNELDIAESALSQITERYRKGQARIGSNSPKRSPMGHNSRLQYASVDW